MKRIAKIIYNLVNFLTTVAYRFYLKAIGVSCGGNLKLKGLPFIFSNQRQQISIGERVTLSSGILSNPAGVNHRCIIRTIGSGQIRIGNDVGISGSTVLATSRIVLGDGVLIGANCKIVDSDLHPIDSAARLRMDPEKIECKDVILEENVWLGMNVLVLKGVTIGRNTVVGAGAVVTKSLPDNVIAAGNPAKVVKVLAPPES